MAKKKPKLTEQANLSRKTLFHAEIDRTVYQYRFLEAIRIHVGHILEELTGEIFCAYQAEPDKVRKFLPPTIVVTEVGIVPTTSSDATYIAPQWWYLLERWARKKRLLVPCPRLTDVPSSSSSTTTTPVETGGSKNSSLHLWRLLEWYEGHSFIPQERLWEGKPFPDINDPDEIFGLMLIRVIVRTMKSWHEEGIPSELRWVYPHGVPGSFFKNHDHSTDRLFKMYLHDRNQFSDSAEKFLNIITKAVPTYKLPAWDLTRQSRSSYIKATIVEFKKFLSAFIDDVENAAPIASLIPTVNDKDDHYKRLAIYQLSDVNQHDVAELEESKRPTGTDRNFGSSRTKVNQSLHAVAKRVVGPGYKIWLKERHVGRPKGKHSEQ